MLRWRGISIGVLLLTLFLTTVYCEQAQAERRRGGLFRGLFRRGGAARSVSTRRCAPQRQNRGKAARNQGRRRAFQNRNQVVRRQDVFDNRFNPFLGNDVFVDGFNNSGIDNRFGLNPLFLGFDNNGEAIFSQRVAVDRNGNRVLLRQGAIIGSTVVDPAAIVGRDPSLSVDGFAGNGFSGEGFSQFPGAFVNDVFEIRARRTCRDDEQCIR